MSKIIKKLQAEQAAIKARLQELRDTLDEDGLTDEQRAEMHEKINRSKQIKSDLELASEADTRLDEMEETRAMPVHPPASGVKVGTDLETEKPWRSFGEQMVAVYRAGCPDSYVDKRLLRAASGLNESVPSDGGYLVQKEFVEELLRRTYETGVLASRCRKIPITNPNANGIKINAIAETSRANGSRWGGVQAYWVDEAAQKTASKPQFRQMELDLKKLIGLCYATDELLMDAGALESVLTAGFSEEFGFKIDDAIINGDGAGKPLGIMNSAAMITVAKEAGQAAQTIVTENITNMWSRAYGRGRGNSAWFINQDIEPQLHGMTIAVGAGGVPVYLPANGLSGSPYSTLYGLPVIPLEQCQTLGTAGDVILADFSQYLLIDKGAMDSASSIHVRFVYDESCFRFVYRIDGQSIWDSPLTPFKGTKTQSPFIRLATRA